MKKLFTSTLSLLFGATMAMAQSLWVDNTEISEDVNFGNLKFEEPLQDGQMNFWKFTSSGGSINKDVGLFECYDGSNCDLYQVVKLPAGLYKVECQGYYRNGGSGDSDPNSWFDGSFENNAFIYANIGSYDEESQKFTEGLNYENNLMPRLYPGVTQQLYIEPEGSDRTWATDGVYQNGVTGPCCVEGSLVWFQNGIYEPVSNETEEYNTVTFYVEKESYVKLGVKKIPVKAQDSFMATNFHLYFVQAGGDEVKLFLLKKQCESLLNKTNALLKTLSGDKLGAIAEDVVMNFKDEYGKISAITSEAKGNEYFTTITEIYNQLNAAITDYNNVQAALVGMTSLCEKTDFPGKDEFKELIDMANSCFGSNFDMADDDDLTFFAKLYDQIIKARVDYLMSQDAAIERDFTALVSFPWFCLPQYEPTYDAENNRWIPNDDALNTDSGDGTTWSEKNDVNGTINNIAKGVVVNGKDGTPGVWCQGGTAGGSLEVYWECKLTCVKKWDAPHTGENEYHDVYQLITGLPNGYYKLKGLAKTWGNDGDGWCKNHFYIKSSTMESHSPYLDRFIWWDNDVNNWTELETDMIQVTDGQVTIGSRDNGFAAFTGFRLFYMGETPNFDEMLRPDKEKAYAAYQEKVTFPGDQKYVESLFAQFPENITDNTQFLAATELLKQINDYINNAYNAVSNFKAPEVYENYLADYSESDDVYMIILPAYNFAQALGEGDDDVYQDCIDADNVCKAYQEYIALREKAEEKYGTDSNVKAVLADQAALLSAKCSDIEELAKCMSELQAPMNKILFAELGAFNADEDNPVNLTSELLVNPSFEYGPSYGWTCEGANPASNEYSQGNAEVWNQGAFRIYQTLRSLPAGTYEVRSRAFYRDGGGVGSPNDGPYCAWWYDAGAMMEYWVNHNVYIFGESNGICMTSPVKSICDGKFTEPSFVGYFRTSDGGYRNNGCVLAEELTEEDLPLYVDEDGVPQYSTFGDAINMENPGYPYDARVIDVEDTLYYPASTVGAYARMKHSPEAYNNSVQIYVEDGQDLQVGFLKDVAISGDWLIYDDFEIYYLGSEISSSIDAAEVSAKSANESQRIYNLAGQLVGNDFKGIVIKNGVKKLNN